MKPIYEEFNRIRNNLLAIPFAQKTWMVLKTSLLSYGIVAFVTHPIPALLIFFSTCYHPLVGIFGFSGSVISNVTARWMGANPAAWRTGVHGVSGLLVGLALGMYAIPSIKMLLLMMVGAAAAGVISTFLSASLARRDLPILSLPMMLIIWPLLIAIGIDKVNSHVFAAVGLLRSLDIWLFDHLPLSLFEFVKMFGNILFQENLISGVLVLLALFLYSRISLLYAFGGGVLGMMVYYYLHGSLDGFHGLNFILIALAFGGYFIVSNKHAFVFTTLAVVTAGLVDYAAFKFLNPPTAISVSTLPSALFNTKTEQIPTLVFAFNVVTLTFLYPLKIALHTQKMPRLFPIPLELIKNPEANLRWARRWLSNLYIQKTMITFPFLGKWSVLQGNNGEWTHKDKGQYAWDFIVTDDNNQQFRSQGHVLEDYYCYGLPVLAPASGVVIAWENNVDDNPPGTATTEHNWGNYLLLDHGNGEFSELSHFRKGSLQVLPGQNVTRGQLLGYCGNSGRSPVPHIHFQLQSEPRPGGATLPVCFAEGYANDEIRINLIPKKNDSLTPLQIDAEAEWGLLGREGEMWEFDCRIGIRRFQEILHFTTDAYGLPVITSKNQNLWYIIDKPNFVQITPDFKTFPTFLSPSGFMTLVEESLILPKKLTRSLTWRGGKILEAQGDLWTIETHGRHFIIDTQRNVIVRAVLYGESGFKFELKRIFRAEG